MNEEFGIREANQILAAMDSFEPCVWFDADADQLNFLAKNEHYAGRRIDGLITQFINLHTDELVGFKIKGFRDVYNKVAKETGLEPDDEGFVDLVEFLEEVFWELATENQKEIYYEARKMARGQKFSMRKAA